MIKWAFGLLPGGTLQSRRKRQPPPAGLNVTEICILGNEGFVAPQMAPHQTKAGEHLTRIYPPNCGTLSGNVARASTRERHTRPQRIPLARHPLCGAHIQEGVHEPLPRKWGPRPALEPPAAAAPDRQANRNKAALPAKGSMPLSTCYATSQNCYFLYT